MSNENLTQINKVALSIILLSLMLIVSYIEALLPLSIGSFGVKIGLSNIMTILCLLTIGIKYSLIINILRLIIMGILFGNSVRFGISVSGFVFSFIVLVIFLKNIKFSIIVSSIFGAVAHNIGQIFAISLITKNLRVMAIIPIYVLLGILTGALIGIISSILYNKLKLIIFDKS